MKGNQDSKSEFRYSPIEQEKEETQGY